ncbi:alpha-L-fucosidase [Kribbella sp. NPDC048915]|uniref:alpha-L-fucosidase n=1 Tax=Kribbella sp. NPDC048915 TaxID=3155148 RepID=UPI0033DDCA09
MTSTPSTAAESAWFTTARFGLFIHWGLFSMTGRDFAHQRETAMTATQYADHYFPRFDPDLYDPEAWADAAAQAGMKYVVIVAKHHEGFCLWDSQYTDFTAVNAPAGRDLLRPMLEAFRSRGLRTGLYYSLLDWHHPDFTVDQVHPQAHGDREQLNAGRDMARYREYVHNQVRELLTDYGPIDVFWPDYSYDDAAWDHRSSNPRNKAAFLDAVKTGWTRFDPAVDPGKGAEDWDATGLMKLIRELQPQILVNDRLGNDFDIVTPEQAVPGSWPTLADGTPAVWETCETIYGAWGYTPTMPNLKSPEQLVTLLIEVVGKGGNLLLNLGPNGRGEIDPPSLERLASVGEWMGLHGRSIHGCTQAPMELVSSLPLGTAATYNPQTRRLYLHLLQWPSHPLVVPGLGTQVEYTQFLHDGAEVRPPSHPLALLHAPDPDDLWLELPIVKPDVTVPVIEVFLSAGSGRTR